MQDRAIVVCFQQSVVQPELVRASAGRWQLGACDLPPVQRAAPDRRLLRPLPRGAQLRPHPGPRADRRVVPQRRLQANCPRGDGGFDCLVQVGLMDGTVWREVLHALEAEGAPEAAGFRELMRNRTLGNGRGWEGWNVMDNPAGSEFAWDTTGQVSQSERTPDRTLSSSP